MFSAVVFAYSEVGLRCLRTLLAHGVRVPLVFTYEDPPGEWHGSVAALAREHGIETATGVDPAQSPWLERIAAIAPDYILSFYYRSMLPAVVLNLARRGALNMHGALLPCYRGRAPVNWAIANGETRVGATLHYMVDKPDAGAVVGQEAVPVGINDHALEVSLGVAAAAARVLERALPAMQAGPPPGTPLDLSKGSYFGGRTPEDGRIDWSWPAARVHALIRAVSPPFPGAFTDLPAGRLIFAHSRWSGDAAAHSPAVPCLYADADRLYLDCSDGLRLGVDTLLLDGAPLDAHGFRRRFGAAPLDLLKETRS